MGNISSKPDEGSALYLRDQTRCEWKHCGAPVPNPSKLIPILVSIAVLTVSNSSRNVVLNVTPNAFPAVRLTAKRNSGDDTPVNYVQVGKIALLPRFKRNGLMDSMAGP
jgi:Arf-GAP with SH3 domain, ANK repeat and PH domain-containing protein